MKSAALSAALLSMVDGVDGVDDGREALEWPLHYALEWLLILDNCSDC